MIDRRFDRLTAEAAALPSGAAGLHLGLVCHRQALAGLLDGLATVLKSLAGQPPKCRAMGLLVMPGDSHIGIIDMLLLS